MSVNDIPSIVSSPVYLLPMILRYGRNRDGYLALQNDFNLLYDWSFTWQQTFNILKYQHLHLGPPHHFVPYHINSLVIYNVTSHKDFGIEFDNQLKFHEHANEVCRKYNRIIGMINKKSFEHQCSPRKRGTRKERECINRNN